MSGGEAGLHLAGLGGWGLGGRGRSCGGGCCCCRSSNGSGWRLWRHLLGRRSSDGDVLDRDAMWGDVVDLPRRGDVDEVIGLDLDLVARWQESVEAHDEVGVTFEELRHSADHSRGVDTGSTGTNLSAESLITSFSIYFYRFFWGGKL